MAGLEDLITKDEIKHLHQSRGEHTAARTYFSTGELRNKTAAMFAPALSPKIVTYFLGQIGTRSTTRKI
jgi:hypothetical protein